MFDITEKACFLKVVRPPSKTVKHVLSGKCEIERYSISSDHQSLCKLLFNLRILHPAFQNALVIQKDLFFFSSI